MKGTIDLRKGVQFEARSGSGHTLVLEGSPESGGINEGMRPMEALLLGMGGCTAYDVAQILRRQRREPSSLAIEMEAKRSEQVPMVFTHIHLKYRVGGSGITERQVKRAIDLSIEKYCSATRMLAMTAKVTYEFEVRDI